MRQTRRSWKARPNLLPIATPFFEIWDKKINFSDSHFSLELRSAYRGSGATGRMSVSQLSSKVMNTPPYTPAPPLWPWIFKFRIAATTSATLPIDSAIILTINWSSSHTAYSFSSSSAPPPPPPLLLLLLCLLLLLRSSSSSVDLNILNIQISNSSCNLCNIVDRLRDNFDNQFDGPVW